MQAKMTLIGLYNYLYDENLDDPDVLFSGLTVPADTYDLDLLKATILLRGGGFEVMYPDPDFLRTKPGPSYYNRAETGP